jgi:hypothetical protein
LHTELSRGSAVLFYQPLFHLFVYEFVHNGSLRSIKHVWIFKCDFDVVSRLSALCSEICRLKDVGVASNSRHLQMRGQKCEMGKGKKERR